MRHDALSHPPTLFPTLRWLACAAILGLALGGCSNRDDASDGPDIVSGADSAENDTAGNLEDGGAEDAGPSTDSTNDDAIAKDSAEPDSADDDAGDNDSADDDAGDNDSADDDAGDNDAGTIPDTPCASDKDCAALDAVCDVDAGQCVACNVDADCTDDAVPVCKNHMCVPPPTACETSKQCFDAGKVCDAAAGFCVDCLADVDCEATSYCAVSATSSLENACLPDVCADGETRCHPESGVHQTCNAAGSDFDDTPCAADTQLCKEGTCADIVCTPNAVSCFSADGLPDAVITCSADGTEEAETLCNSDEACVDDGQGGATCEKTTCTPGTTSCDDGANAVLVCNNNGVGSSPVPCTGGTVCAVDDGDGKASCKPTICTPGGHFCDGTKKLLCDAKGLSGSEVVDCAAGGGICLNGECASNLCSQGSTQCDGDDKLATCNDPAKGWEVTPCPSGQACAAGACKAKVCEKGSTQCKDANTVETCDEPTVGYSGATPCGNDQLCSAGVCVVAKCVVGTTQCKDATTLETCKDATVGFEAEACPSGQGCDVASGSCKAQTCTPGTASCAGDKVVTCDVAGLSEVVSDDCGAKGETCDAATASCKVAPSCVAWDVELGLPNGVDAVTGITATPAGYIYVLHAANTSTNKSPRVQVFTDKGTLVASETVVAVPESEFEMVNSGTVHPGGGVLYGGRVVSAQTAEPAVVRVGPNGNTMWSWQGKESDPLALVYDVEVVGDKVVTVVWGSKGAPPIRLRVLEAATGLQVDAIDFPLSISSKATGTALVPLGSAVVDVLGSLQGSAWSARVNLVSKVVTENQTSTGAIGDMSAAKSNGQTALGVANGLLWKRSEAGAAAFSATPPGASNPAMAGLKYVNRTLVVQDGGTYGCIVASSTKPDDASAWWVTFDMSASYLASSHIESTTNVSFGAIVSPVSAVSTGGVVFVTKSAADKVELRRVPDMLAWTCD